MNYKEHSTQLDIDKKHVPKALREKLDKLINSGGDGRLSKNELNLNKYFISPTAYESIINRGSCTCSPFTPEAFFSTSEFLSELNDDNFESYKSRQTSQLKSLINKGEQDNFEIFYAPSGSDLCYFPLIFSKIICPDKTISNLVTCPEELGSGSQLASKGKYYFDLNQYGNPTELGATIDHALDVEKIDFPARDPNGLINDHDQRISEVITEKLKQGHSVICNLVIGSKSGIEDNLDIIPKFNDEVLFVIDICQARVTSSLIKKLLDLSCCIMITGSKFYQSPPFCGALLVPMPLVERLKASENTIVDSYHKVFTKHDFPESLAKIRNNFPDYQNKGLLLRWHAAIYEMTQLSTINNTTLYKLIIKWNESINEELTKYRNRFTIMPGTDETNKSIISFRIKDKNNEYLNYKQLWSVYEAISTSTHPNLGEYNKILMGQPVSYGNKSFLRVALGSYEIRQLIKNDGDLTLDKEIIKTIYQTVEELF